MKKERTWVHSKAQNHIVRANFTSPHLCTWLAVPNCGRAYQKQIIFWIVTVQMGQMALSSFIQKLANVCVKITMGPTIQPSSTLHDMWTNTVLCYHGTLQLKPTEKDLTTHISVMWIWILWGFILEHVGVEIHSKSTYWILNYSK